MKVLNKLIEKESLIKILCIFFIVSIFLDLHILYNSVSTLIRCIIITIIFLIIYFKYANKKEKRMLIIYFGLLAIYIVFHMINVNNFNNSSFTSSNMSELLYFYKMIMNVLLIFITYKLGLKKETFLKTITISAFIISFIIVISDLLKIGYTSYDFNKITYSIIDWFKTKNIDFMSSSSKGYFHLTNQISAILALYLPIVLLSVKEKKSVFNIVTMFLTIISLFMLGTRISTYSTFIILIIVFIVYLFTRVNEKGMDYIYLIILGLGVALSYVLYINCPLISRNKYYDELFKEKEKIEEPADPIEIVEPKILSNEEFKEFLQNYNIVSDFYLYHYPLENDREFYENYINLDTTKVNDTRFLEEQIILRVKTLNHNKWDNSFGIGYDRSINIFNIEKDYVMQYYSIGIIGLILILCVNVLLVVSFYFKMLFNLKRFLKFDNIVLLFTMFFFLIGAYFSGNILNSISCIIPISFVVGFMLSIINQKDKKEYEYFLGFKTSTLDIDSISNKVFDEKKQTIIYNVNPLIVNNFYKNDKIKKEFNKENYNIPDGNGLVMVSNICSKSVEKSVPGIELFEKICENSIKNKYSVYLYGAKEESASGTVKNLKKKYKKINIKGYINGYTKEEEVLKSIKKAKPDILFVALGSPKQEEFIIRNKNELKDIKIIMPVGGSFDVYSGNLKRAPKLFIKLKLEWLYRMIKEPKRFKQIFSLMKFVIVVLFTNIWYNEDIKGE